VTRRGLLGMLLAAPAAVVAALRATAAPLYYLRANVFHVGGHYPPLRSNIHATPRALTEQLMRDAMERA